jgi:hypothetical protein
MSTARGQTASPVTPVPAASPCGQWEVTYTLTGSLRITGTPLGAGDGIHPIGPGNLVLRTEPRSGRAQLIAFELQERFAVTPHTLLGAAIIRTDASAHVVPDASGQVPSGRLLESVLQWSGPIRGYRTDGTLACEGTLCGKMGAPPAGRNELHLAVPSVVFQPLQFAADRATFQMGYGLVAESKSPPQKTYLAVSGRRTRQVCVSPSP